MPASGRSILGNATQNCRIQYTDLQGVLTGGRIACLVVCSCLPQAYGVDTTSVPLPPPAEQSPVYLKSFPESNPGDADNEPVDLARKGRWGITPSPPPPPPAGNEIRWGPLFQQASFFLGLQHGFRLMTEPGTRKGLKGPFFRGYADAVTNMHGWDDGDPAYVNYIGHPMQGATASYLWLFNDGTYKYAQFGMNRTYWRSRLRTLPFSYFYSTQFEIGPLSEASLGKVQSKYPAQGFVDHAITPVFGLAWVVAEDVLDRFVIIPIERRWDNPLSRMLVRSWLNPARSWSNAMRFKVPWYRDTRAGIFEPYREYSFAPRYEPPKEQGPEKPWQRVAPFEFAANGYALVFSSSGDRYSCVGGGGGQMAFNDSSGWSLVGEVNGCKMYSLAASQSGDGMTFLAGPRYTWRSASRLMPFVQLLGGGHKFTLEQSDPVKYAQLAYKYGTSRIPNEVYDEWHDKWDNVGWAASAGGGLDLGVNRYLTVRLANLDYTYFSQNRPLKDLTFRHGMRFNFGLVLRMGTW